MRSFSGLFIFDSGLEKIVAGNKLQKQSASLCSVFLLSVFLRSCDRRALAISPPAESYSDQVIDNLRCLMTRCTLVRRPSSLHSHGTASPVGRCGPFVARRESLVRANWQETEEPARLRG